MPIGGTRVIDMDSHLVGDVAGWPDFIEDEWRSYLPQRLPVKKGERMRTLVGNNIMWGAGVQGQEGRTEWAGPQDYTAEGRVSNLDKDGIDIAVLSPNSPALDMVWFPDEPKLAAAYCRTENSFMQHYASQYPDRLKWAGVIPFQDRDLAINELHRMKGMGSVGVNMKAVPVMGREWSDTYYDPLWAEVERLKLPLIFHDTRPGSLGIERFYENFFFAHMVGRVLETMVCMMVFICGGPLERHPDLKVIALETGASQMPWWVGRMDEHYEKLGAMVPWLNTPPTEIFKRQVYVGCEPFEDPLFEWAVETLGDDRMVLATDQPHWDSLPPGGAVAPIAQSTKFSESTKKKVLGGNAAELLGL